MRFTLNAEQLELTACNARLRDLSPEPVRQYGVRVGHGLHPVKQAFEAATGVPRSRFTTQVALRHLAALGFELVAAGQPQVTAIKPAEGTLSSGRRVPVVTGSSADNGD